MLAHYHYITPTKAHIMVGGAKKAIEVISIQYDPLSIERGLMTGMLVIEPINNIKSYISHVATKENIAVIMNYSTRSTKLNKELK